MFDKNIYNVFIKISENKIERVVIIM